MSRSDEAILSILAITKQRQERLVALLRDDKARPSDTEGLRSSIREGYEQVMLHCPETAVLHDVDHQLWKTCFYGPVEHYRSLMRRSAKVVQRYNDEREGEGRSARKASAVAARKELKATQIEFKTCIAEASTFYQGLIRRLESAHGKAMIAALSGTSSIDAGSDEAVQSLRSRLVTVSRCWTFLGDLARYKELHSDMGSKDWSTARAFYEKAVTALPSSCGNPHNQLAVTATYQDSEVVALYHYARALSGMTHQPFSPVRVAAKLTLRIVPVFFRST